MEIYNQAFTREYLVIFEYALYAILYLFGRDELHKWISQSSGFLLIYYVFIGRKLSDWAPGSFIAGIIILFFIILFLTIYYIKIVRKKIDKKSYLPIFIVFLFIGSYISGINAKHFHLPWYTGYVLAMISFLIGVVIYRTKTTKKG